MSSIHTLVVGQGLAGTLTAFMLHRKNLSFKVIDPGHANTASRVAAGMFTPVSGKRKTIAHGAIEQIDLATKTYREIELLLGKKLLHSQQVYELCYRGDEKDLWEKRAAETGFDKYVKRGPAFINGFAQPFCSYEVSNSGWLDCELLSTGFAAWLEQRELLIKDNFLHDLLEPGIDSMHYRGLEFKNVFFCEGYQAGKNPFFSEEKIIPCKGDLLTIRYEAMDADFIIKANGLYLINTGENLLRVGASYQWNNDATEPDPLQRQLLEGQLNSLLTQSFTTVEHDSAVRPTTADRAVIAKQHDRYKNMFFLNGFGTRGVLQGPWWANYLVNRAIDV